jgi:hypothetical protein
MFSVKLSSSHINELNLIIVVAVTSFQRNYHIMFHPSCKVLLICQLLVLYLYGTCMGACVIICEAISLQTEEQNDPKVS